MATTVPVPNECIGRNTREASDGRRLTYKLSVIQQPERARACGQGAKASSDRRPVDPPPIVELHIYDGEETVQNEVTFSYNANFFLFATLENARTIAQGRVNAAQAANTAPVLTGTPVAGMAYLDRPNPAGYFIFPDLSVRHEGKYRLSFTLYEQYKDPKDATADASEQHYLKETGPAGHVHNRCEVRSVPFTVYSAKKFPGLAESTTLSRTVADQGTRVRIRRDVRMRRRDSGKPNKDWDDYEDKTSPTDGAIAATPTPDPAAHAQPSTTVSTAVDPVERPASASTVSYQMAPSRRASIQETPQQHYPSQQMTPQSASTAYMSHDASAASNASAPPPPYASHYDPYSAPPPHHHPQYMQQQQQMVPQYQPSPYTYPACGYVTGPSPPQATMYEQSQHMSYGPPPPAPNFAPSGAPVPQQQHYAQANAMQNGNMAPHGGFVQSQLPPLKPFEAAAQQSKMEPASPQTSRPPSYDFGARPAPPSQYVNSSTGPAPKRAYGSVFNTQHLDQPLRSGARPDNCFTGSPLEISDGSDEDIDMEQLKMTYRRANGDYIARTWPQYNA